MSKTDDPDDEEEVEDDICGGCNGSGEGMYDGSTCNTCRGSGEVCGACGSAHGPNGSPDCSRGGEPDWDAIAEDRRELASLRDSESNDEVEWESPK